MMMNKSNNNVAQTCNRLSQFLKERRSLGRFPSFHNMLDINGTKEMLNVTTNTTMNLFPKKMEEEKNDSSTGENLKSLDLFPLKSSSTADESNKSMADSSELPRSIEEPKTTAAKMTIFYGGQVLVFDDFPEDKAQEIMSLASQLEIVGSHSEAQAQAQAQAQALPNNELMAQSGFQQPASLSDLPIARRVSLHRFMEKRKDRIAAASPYQLHNRSLDKYEMMRNLDQHQQQELELKLF